MYIAIDIGGSNTRIGTLASLDVLDVALIAKFSTQQNYEQQLRSITDALRGYETMAFEGIGISIAGRIAKDGRSVLVAPNLPEYVGRPFALAMLTRVEAIAISGAIVLNRPTLLVDAQEKINARIKGATLALHFATLGENAPLVGAAVLLEVPEETIVH